MTKCALGLMDEALAMALQSLPAYAHPFSRRDFTLHQLFAILVLRKFLRVDSRGVVAIVAEWSDLRRLLALNKVPHHSTLWYAERKLLEGGPLIGSSPRVSIERARSA